MRDYFLRKLTLITVALFVSNIAISQVPTLEWAKSFLPRGYDSVVDDAGNVYTTGYFGTTQDFDPGPGVFNLTAVGFVDVYVQKLDASGNLVWAQSFGGTSSDVGNGISVDAAGNVYTIGRFEGTVDFDPGPGVDNHTSAGGDDIFVQKLDASGNFVWAATFGGTSGDEGLCIAVDPTGNVHTSGFFSGSIDFDPGPGVYNVNSSSGTVFVQKLDAAGNFIWAAQYGSAFPTSLKLDDSGNVYAVGYFSGTADFYPSSGVFNLTSAGVYDVFVQKLDASGGFLWAKSFGGISNDYGRSVAIDGAGNVYTVGEFQGGGGVDFDPGPGVNNIVSSGGVDAFIQKLDALGNFVWVKTFGDLSNETCRSITADNAGTIYATGAFGGTVDFDPGVGTTNLTSAGNKDIFVLKLNAAGNFQWAESFGSTLDDEGLDIELLGLGSVHVMGNFEGTVDFEPGAGITNLVSVIADNTFIQKLCQTSYSTDAIVACDSYTWTDGNSYTASNNTATDTFTNYLGCDSIVTLDLTINYSSAETDVIMACDSYTWIDGNTYTSSNNTATETLTTVAGCDSVVTLDLTINYSSASTDVIVACDSYMWIDGNTYTSSNNTATETLTNAAGCDSIVTLDLTINYSSVETDVIVGCDSITWIDGNTYTVSNNTATHTLTTVAGCDSVIALDLTITDINTGVIQNQNILTSSETGAAYQWLQCPTMSSLPGETSQEFTATFNGDFAVVVTLNGCSDTSDCYPVTTVGVNETDFGSLKIFPNPSNGTFYIDFGEKVSSPKICITDLSGRVIVSEQYLDAQFLDFQLDGAPGMYLLTVESDNKRSIIRILKE